MKRFRFAAGLALALLSVLSLAAPTRAGDQIPFRGRLDGVVTHSAVSPTVDSVHIEAGGNATHLGRFTLSVPHLVNRANMTAAGTYEFTAANGDTVFAEFTGQAALTTTPGVLYIVETATITGGTGRFAGATGGFIAERLYDRVAGTTTGSFEGTISSPGFGNH